MEMNMENEMEPGILDLNYVGPGFALRSAIMFSGARLSRIGYHVRSVLMCLFIWVPSTQTTAPQRPGGPY